MPVLTNRSFAAALGSAFFAVALLVSTAAVVSAQSLKAAWTGNAMSIAAVNVPLATVLTEVARLTGSSVVGLEKATELVTVEIDSATLHVALRTLLADKNYIYFERHSPQAAAYDRVSLWVYGKSGGAWPSSCRATNAGRPVPCDDANGDVADEGPASAAATFTTEPFPRGPSAAEAEAARLADDGAFGPAASHGSLMSLSTAPDPEVRARALQALAIQNTPAGVQAIIAALEDPEPLVRGEALHLALSIGAPGVDAVAQLRDLLDHRDPGVRFAAAMALGEQPGSEAEFQLRRALGDTDESVKSAAAQVLRQQEQRSGTIKRK